MNCSHSFQFKANLFIMILLTIIQIWILEDLIRFLNKLYLKWIYMKIKLKFKFYQKYLIDLRDS